MSVASDVSQTQSVNECFKQVLDQYKRAPDIIVNSAGITKDVFMLRMKEEDFDKVIDVNLKGTFLVTQVNYKDTRYQACYKKIQFRQQQVL